MPSRSSRSDVTRVGRLFDAEVLPPFAGLVGQHRHRGGVARQRTVQLHRVRGDDDECLYTAGTEACEELVEAPDDLGRDGGPGRAGKAEHHRHLADETLKPRQSPVLAAAARD